MTKKLSILVITILMVLSIVGTTHAEKAGDKDAPGLRINLASITLKLSTRSRAQMAVYSLFVPGLGQHCGGRYKSSKFFMITGLAAMAGAATGYLLYDQALDDYRVFTNRYQKAFYPDDIDKARQSMIDAYYDADTKFYLRLGAFVVLGAVWSANVLHALIFGPDTSLEYRQSYMNPSNWEIEPQINSESTQIVIRYRR